MRVCLLGTTLSSLTAVRPHETSGIPEWFESVNFMQSSCFQSVVIWYRECMTCGEIQARLGDQIKETKYETTNHDQNSLSNCDGGDCGRPSSACRGTHEDYGASDHNSYGKRSEQQTHTRNQPTGCRRHPRQGTPEGAWLGSGSGTVCRTRSVHPDRRRFGPEPGHASR